MKLPKRGKLKHRSFFLFSVSLVGVCLCIFIGLLFTRTLEGADSPGCRMVYMGPSYARIRALDASHSRLASKYSLYLYREQGEDDLPRETNGFALTGIPVLFIPGNAGSFRQVRSIAAKTSNLFSEGLEDIENDKTSNFDFFSADFNEDFTAFHGRTMLDQAEYVNDAIRFIISLYVNTEYPPKSVILVGHSMGGIVSRVAITLNNYVSESINTIITLASPHAAAPLTFDEDILKAYSAIDMFWHDGFHLRDIGDGKNVAHERLKNVSLISITGGLLDSTLPSDYTTLGSLVPPTNGFTVYTTGIPEVWTPVDHLAIVWCGQLRAKISRALLEIANYTSPGKTLPLTRRMEIFRKLFLSGFEDYASQDLNSYKSSETHICLKINPSKDKIESKMAIYQDGNGRDVKSKPTVSLFRLSSQKSETFSLLSNIKPQSFSSSSTFSILLCKSGKDIFNLNEEQLVSTDMDFEFNCVDASKDYHLVPRSSGDRTILSDSSYGGDLSPFYALQFNSTILSNYDSILVHDSHDFGEEDFVTADLVDSEKRTIKTKLPMLLGLSAEIKVPAQHSTAINVEVQGASSSLLSYRLKVIYPESGSSNKLYSPILRQWSAEPYEVKWYINIAEGHSINLSIHGIAPFVPFKKEKRNSGLQFELWSETMLSNFPIIMRIDVDLIDSLRLLVLRYRLSIIAFCISTTLFAILFQLKYWHKTGIFPNFQYGLALLCSPANFIGIFIILGLFGPIVKFDHVKKILNIIDPVVLQDNNEINISLHEDFELNNYFLGLEEDNLWFLGPLFFIISIGLVCVTNVAVTAIIQLVGYLIHTIVGTNEMEISNTLVSESNSCGNERRTSNRNSRFVTMAVLIVVILLYVPFQFAYAICCIAQGIVLIRTSLSKKCPKGFYNYQQSIFILLLWTLPISIPTLIVFVHNLSVSWKTPFSSHRNVMSVLPILLMIEKNISTQSLPALSKRPIVTQGLIWYIIFYSYIYGSRHTYWLHHLINVLCGWLFILSMNIDENTKN